MKKLALYLISLVLANTAAAQTKVGLIDISRAVLSTSQGKSDLEALDKKFEPRKTELLKQGTDLQALQKQLAEDGAKLSDDARAATLKTLEHKQLDLQHAAENAQADYDRERSEIIGRILKKMAPVIDKYGRDNGYAIIFDAQFWPSGPVLWASGSTADITGAVVTSYNAQAGSAAPAPAASSTGGASSSPQR